MKNSLIILAIYLFAIGCKNNSQENISSEKISSNINSLTKVQDSVEVLDLIKKVMIWQDSKDRIGILPLEGNDSNICIGVDYQLQKENIEKLQNSNFFSNNFILNYKKIIDRLDVMIKKGEVEKFDIAEMPPFNFATDVSPWCNCQDNFDWDKIELKELKINHNNCEFKWGWKEWKDFSYSVKAIKEDDVWKIEQMEGFDYIEATK